VKASIRKQVQERDRMCRGCGSGSPSEVHHIKYRSAGGMDTLANLVWLCGDCHRDAHSTGRGETIEGWELSLVVDQDVPTVLTLRKRGMDRVCGGCEFRTNDDRCMVWDREVTWDLTCGSWARRNRRMENAPKGR
jgi:hypothetical protein